MFFFKLIKANYRREHGDQKEPFIYPYDLGLKENLRQVFNWNGSPRFQPIGNGIKWNVNEFSNQYSLTVEQLLQKEEKRIHSVKYNVIKSYNGSYCAIKHGIKAACCFPWTEDPRMMIYENETVRVTRWQRHWLYGELNKTDESSSSNKKRRNRYILRRVAN